MAQEVQIPGTGSTAKIRNIVAVPVLAFITLAIYCSSGGTSSTAS
jgi:hypothetical protein